MFGHFDECFRRIASFSYMHNLTSCYFSSSLSLFDRFFVLLFHSHLILGRAEAVSLLLQAGANARQAAVTGVFLGKTPLMWASSQGRTEVVRLLLLAGVDVNYSSHFGNFKVHLTDDFIYFFYFLF